MSKILEKVNLTLYAADSKKVTDRKRCISELLELYENKEVIKEITKYSVENEDKIPSWSSIFIAIHKLALQEAEKLGTKDNYKTNISTQKQQICLVLLKTVRFSCESPKLTIRCSNLIQRILNVLSKKLYAAYHDSYLMILLNYVLPITFYRTNILPDQWKALLNTCISLYENVPISVNRKILIDAIQMIVKYGSLYCDLALEVKKLLSFLENILLDNNTAEEIEESTYKLANTICHQIATENRIMLCQFSEHVLPKVINLNNYDEKYKLMSLSIQIHHPKGVDRKHEIAFACNWDIWNSILQRMYDIVLNNSKTIILSKSFLCFASEVLQQVLQNSDIVWEKRFSTDLYSQPAKRKCSVITSPLELIDDTDAKKAWAIIQILTVLFAKYPNSLKLNDYIPVLKILNTLLTESFDQEKIIDSIYEMCIVLVEIEQQFFNGTKEMEFAKTYWYNIWDILLRSIHTNRNEISSHRLLLCLIKARKIKSSSTLFSSYVTNTMKWSQHSLNTLLLLCKCVPLPDDVSMFNRNRYLSSLDSYSAKLHFMKWLLNTPWHKIPSKMCIENLCNILIGLSNDFVTEECKELEQSDLIFPIYETRISFLEELTRDDSDSIFYKNVELCNLALKFQVSLCIERKMPERKQLFSKANISTIDAKDALDISVKYLNDLLNNKDGNNDVRTMIVKITLVATIVSTFKKMNTPLEEAQVNSVIDTIKKCLQQAYDLLEINELSQNKYAYLISVMEALNILFEIPYDITIAKVITSSLSVNVLRNIFDLLNIENSTNLSYHEIRRYNDNLKILENKYNYLSKEQVDYNVQNIYSVNAIRIQTMKTLALFCCINTGDEVLETQINLMSNLLTIDMYDFTSTIDFKMAMIILEQLMESDQTMLHKKYGDAPVKFLSNLFQRCYKNERYARSILKILPNFLQYIASHNCELISIIDTLLEFSNLLVSNKFGSLMRVTFLKCLSRIIEIEISLRQHFQYNDCQYKIWAIIKNLLYYINSSFYVVRLQVVQCLRTLYSLKDIDIKLKKSYFDKLRELMHSLLNTDKFSNEEKMDETETRTASALLMLTIVICSDGILQNSALLTILELVETEKLKVEAAQKALNSIGKQTEYAKLTENNVICMLSYWLSSEHSIRTFPWMLIQCESEEEYYKSYMNILVFVEIQHFNLDDAVKLCEFMNFKFSCVFENIFTQILSWLLVCICESVPNDPLRSQLANKMFHKVISGQTPFISTCSFSEMLKNNFDKIVANIMGKLCDEEHFKQVFELSVIFPEDYPPELKVYDVDECFKYIEKHFFQNTASLQYNLTNNGMSALQKILLNLTSNIYKMKFIEHKLKALHQYVYFCMIMIEGLKDDYCNDISMFFIREVSYTLLHLIKNDIPVMSETACKFLKIFLQKALPERSTEIKKLLNSYVTNLLPIAMSGRVQVALEVLQFLIIDQKEVLCDAIRNLDTFPNIPIFQRIRNAHHSLKYQTENIYNLEKEIRHFLQATNQKVINCNIESLLHLNYQLSVKRNELQEMHNMFELSDQYNLTELHQLVYRLVKISRSSNDNVAIEAVKCLGQLGPIDLTSAILHAGQNYDKEKIDVLDMLTYSVVALLTEFLIENNIYLRETSANVLYVIFSSPWGQKLTDKYHLKNMQSALNELECPLEIEYIRPFINNGTSEISDMPIDNTITLMSNLKKYINPNNTIWSSKSSMSYSEWITEITCDIANCFTELFVNSLVPVCKLNIEMCELILPKILFVIMYLEKELANSVCYCINRFFAYHFHIPNKYTEETENVCCDRNTVHCMLNIVNFIRVHANDEVPVELDFIHIAKAAQYCSAYFTTFLYAELSCESLLKEFRDFSSIPKIDYVCEYEPVKGRILQNILRDACTKIGDPDTIHGCGSSHLQHRSSRVQHYVQMREWDKVILSQDIDLSFGNKKATGEMVNALQQSGFHYLLGNFISSINSYDQEVSNDIQLECTWRLSNWDAYAAHHIFWSKHDHDTNLQLTESDYYLYHYLALKCFHENNELGIKNALNCARTCIIKALNNINFECNKAMYEKLMQLQMLREIEELCLTNPKEYFSLLNDWQQYNMTNFIEFQYVEPVLTQRSVMFQIKEALRNNPVIRETLLNTYMQIAEIAQDQGYLQIAARALGSLAKQNNLSPEFQHLLDYQESLLSWKRNNHDIGRFLLRDLINKRSVNSNLQARMLCTYGNWMAETKSENPQTVIDKYYFESIRISTSIENKTKDVIKNLCDTQMALARFADTQYENIKMYMKSPQFEGLKECVEYSRNLMQLDLTSKDKDLRRAVILGQKQNTNDAAELKNIEKEKNNYLIIAIRYYLLTLCQSEDYNLLVFRLIALWLENAHHEEVNKLLQENLEAIPSFKFIPLVPQLAAHMSNGFDDFSQKIYQILKRCAQDHPHHTLPVLLALKNLYGDYEFLSTRRNTKLKEEPRILGAKKLLTQLSNSKIALIIKEMEKLSYSLVMLANMGVDSFKRGLKHQIPRGQEILQIKNLCNTLVPTITISIKPTGNYSDIIGVNRYSEIFELVGGVNAPKKIVCIGTDGVFYEQLLKGKDDLRQDAVMQQVFNVMNTLLKTSKETKRRKLKIRTYKVIPLTQRSGILEWCRNTIPIVAVLIGRDSESGVHKKYYPRNYSAKKCREMMQDVAKASHNVKLQTFLTCCKNMRPAFHHFFMEKYPSPETWYAKRLAYTRSVATTSMAGYIVGLGDRHLNNILIDQWTAEVIHIDFGIAFEQGKILPVPETVPFRLTRDIEVAMGVSGVEGIMRRSCEETLTVLRDQRQIIITLLQVLLYDPLFTWAITPAEAYNLQSGNARTYSEHNQVLSETNKSAERALLRIEQKLQGTEEGLMSNISGQVERLIQQARDPSNLCRLFAGWQAYL